MRRMVLCGTCGWILLWWRQKTRLRPRWNRGRKMSMSDEQKAKISAALKGRKVSPETLARICAANSNPSPERRAKISRTLWRGGKKVVSARHHAKRRTLGFVQLNKSFVGCEGHHVDNEQVINMPKPIHRSIVHNIWTGKNMAKINAVAYNFLFKQEVETAMME